MGKDPREWLKQADYDMDTAEYMFAGGRYLYTVFLCHLAVEKALKGIYQKKLESVPPRTHNLLYLIEKTQVQPPADMQKTVVFLNRLSIPTRYPDDLQRMMKDYTQEKTGEIFEKSKEVLRWLKKLY